MLCPFKRYDPQGTSTNHLERFPEVFLEIVRGQARRKRRPVTTPAFLIGSAADCDLVLGAAEFPKCHVYLRVGEWGVKLRHMGFYPAVAINGKTVSSQVLLANGDRIATGPYVFEVCIRERSRTHITSSHDRMVLAVGQSSCEVNGCDQVEALMDEIGRTLHLLEDTRPRLYSGSDFTSQHHSDQPPESRGQWLSSGGLASGF